MSIFPSPFDPLEIGALEIPGRIFKTATSETSADPDGFVTDRLLLFYEQMARGGTPLMITGNLYAGPLGKSTRNMTGIDSDEKIPGLRGLTDRVHELGSLLFCQVSHCGRQVVADVMGFEPLSASAVREPAMGSMPREMTLSEIAVVVEEFGAAAARAVEAGFDGIQLHGGHGYLISQFLTPHTNRRRDDYGGRFENRTRLLVEIIEAGAPGHGPGVPDPAQDERCRCAAGAGGGSGPTNSCGLHAWHRTRVSMRSRCRLGITSQASGCVQEASRVSTATF